MVALLADAIGVLTQSVTPPPVPLIDYAITNDAGVQSITSWNVARLGPQPTPAALAAITPAQVTAWRKSLQAADAIAAQSGPDRYLTLIRAVALAAGLTAAQVKAQIPNATVG